MKLDRNKKAMIFKWGLVAVALILFMFPSVADKMPQIDSRVMLTAIGLDLKGDELELTAAVTVPSGGTGGGSESAESVTGSSVGELMSNLSRSLGKRAELAHCAMLALGKELCERGVKEEIESLISSDGLSDGISVVAAKDTAKKLIETAANLSKSAAFSLGSFLSFAGEDAQIPMVSLVRFAANNNSIGGGAYLPIIEMSDSSGGGQSGGQSGGEGGSGGEQGGGEENSGGGSGGEGGGSGGGQSGGEGGGQSKAQIISAETTRIFKNYRSVAEFDEETTFALTWLDPQSDRGAVKLEKFELGGVDFGNLTFIVRKKGVDAKASFKDKPTVTVVVDAQVEPEASNRLAELKESGMPILDINTSIKDALSKQMDRQIKAGWEKAKEVKADPFKYAYRLYKKNPARFESEIGFGDDMFDKMTVDTKIEILLI